MARTADAEAPGQGLAARKRLGEMLSIQRDRFRERLVVLDKQRDAIDRGDTGALLSYVGMEEQLVKDLLNLGKVIDPLDRLCSELALSGGGADAGEAALGELKAAVEGLRAETAAHAERNRRLLARRMAEIRAEIKALRGNPYAARHSVYADGAAPQMIDLKG
jgi:hypothetical protein